jgi:hypothetical protein
MYHPRVLVRPPILPALLAATFIPAGTACATHAPGYRDEATESTVKVVESKQPPVTLIATDRSICLVTVQRFRDVRVGDAVYCRWQVGGGRGAPPGAEPGPVVGTWDRLQALSPDRRP